MTSKWLPAPTKILPAAGDEIHVWRASLDKLSDRLSDLLPTLTLDERERAARFQRIHDRARYVTGRGMLRVILARYLATAPDRLRFVYNEHGKPCLAPEWQATGLQFNLAHSGGLALYAVARRRAVGVDLEQVRADFPIEETVTAFMTSGEATALHTLAPAARPLAAYAWWTRREASLKACGSGLSALQARPTAKVSDTPEVSQVDPPRWHPVDLDVGAGYAAALVAEGHDWRPRLFSFT